MPAETLEAPQTPAAAPQKPAESVDSFDKLDALWSQRTTPHTPDTDAAPKKPDAPADATKPKDESKESKDAAAAVAPKKDEKQVVKGEKGGELRAKMESAMKERETIAKERDELKSKIAEFDKAGKDTTALSEQLASATKERDELQSTIRALRQEASPEFKEKWEKPFNDAAEDAAIIFNQLEVVDANGDVRKATWDKDFAALYQLPYPEAKARARDMFADDASVVMDAYNQLHRLQRQKDNALAEERKNWKARNDAETAQRAQHEQFIKDSWPKVNTNIVEKKPEWFAETPDDPEGNELLKKGFALVDAEPKNLEQFLLHKANVRLRAAAFPRMAHRLKLAEAKIAELEATAKEKAESKPGGTKRVVTDGGGDAPKDFASDLRKTMA